MNPCLIPDFRRIALSFSPFGMMFTVGLSQWVSPHLTHEKTEAQKGEETCLELYFLAVYFGFSGASDQTKASLYSLSLSVSHFPPSPSQTGDSVRKETISAGQE